MVDNVAITAGTGTTIAADDVGGALHQRVKATWGPDGTGNDIDVATGKPLPVQLRGSDGTDRSNLLPVSIASGATAIAKAEDVASADADVGVPAMMVRKGTPANTSGTDGDYEMLQGSAGRLWVDPSGVTLTVASHAVTVASGGIASGGIASGAVASGAFASGSIGSGAIASGAIASGAIAAGAITAGATSIAANEDTASADADTGVKVLFKRVDTPANSSGTDGDYEQPQMSAGAIWTTPLGYAVTCSTDITRPADTTAYAANDCFSDSTSAPTSGGYTLTSATRKSAGSSILTDMMIISSAASTLQGEIHLFNQAMTNVNDNAAWTISDADAKNRIAIIPFTLVADAANSYYHAQNLNITCSAVGTANIRYMVKVKAAYTPISGEVLTVKAKFLGID